MAAQTAIGTLKFMAWLAFCLGTVAGLGLILLFKFALLFIAIGLLIMCQGLFFWSLFYVVALIGERVLLTRNEPTPPVPSPVYRTPVPPAVKRYRSL